jgi:hypothetical protein
MQPWTNFLGAEIDADDPYIDVQKAAAAKYAARAELRDKAWTAFANVKGDASSSDVLHACRRGMNSSHVVGVPLLRSPCATRAQRAAGPFSDHVGTESQILSRSMACRLTCDGSYGCGGTYTSRHVQSNLTSGGKHEPL